VFRSGKIPAIFICSHAGGLCSADLLHLLLRYGGDEEMIAPKAKPNSSAAASAPPLQPRHTLLLCEPEPEADDYEHSLHMLEQAYAHHAIAIALTPAKLRSWRETMSVVDCGRLDVRLTTREVTQLVRSVAPITVALPLPVPGPCTALAEKKGSATAAVGVDVNAGALPAVPAVPSTSGALSLPPLTAQPLPAQFAPYIERKVTFGNDCIYCRPALPYTPRVR
jgi:hypothetical protein